MTPVQHTPGGEAQTLTIGAACRIMTPKPPGQTQRPHEAVPRKARHMPQNEIILAYLREFRAENRKDTVISRSGLSDGLISKYPEVLKGTTMRQVHRQITDLLGDVGVARVCKKGTTHQRYIWPLDVMP